MTKERKQELEKQIDDNLKWSYECAETGDPEGAAKFAEAAANLKKQLEPKVSKKDILEIAGVATGLLTAIGGIVVPLAIQNQKNKTLTEAVQLSWAAQLTGEIPAKLTQELTTDLIRESTK